MLYWADTDGRTIMRGSIDGGTPQTLAWAGLTNPWDVAVTDVIPEPSALIAIGVFLPALLRAAWRTS
jgi:hypothetical protein